MLAKIWKKVALAICIVAILFNITNKLVKKTNLKDELQSVMGGNAISFSEESSNSVANKTSNNASSNEDN